MPRLVTCEIVDDIAHVRLDRPDKLNALTLDTLDQLIGMGRTLRGNRSVRAAVLSGNGDAFCAGLDFPRVLGAPAGVVTHLLPPPWRSTNAFQEACWVWRRLPVPVLAVVHGHCLGGGLQLALGADFRFSTPDARWSVMESAWGLIPDMTGIHALSQLTGIDTAKRLAMTGATFTGVEAARLGLVTEVADDPHLAARQFLDVVTGRSPDAVAATKRLFEDTWNRGSRATFARERIAQIGLLLRPNTRAAREAKFRKEAPRFAPRAR